MRAGRSAHDRADNVIEYTWIIAHPYLILLYSKLQILFPILFHCSPQMQGGVFALINAMVPHRVAHHAEHFIVFNQFIRQHFKILVMYIIVGRAMNDEEVPL